MRPIQSASAPRIPTARMITIARVASSISTDRTFQSSFLHSLHAYFLAQRRLVKRDDVVGLSINTDDMREPPDTSIFDNGFPGDSTLKDFDPRFVQVLAGVMNRPLTILLDIYRKLRMRWYFSRLLMLNTTSLQTSLQTALRSRYSGNGDVGLTLRLLALFKRAWSNHEYLR